MARTACLTIATALAVMGCASPVPVEIRDPLPASPEPHAVQLDAERYRGQYVRWGGTVVAVHKQGAELLAEVQSAPLNDGGRPLAGDGDGGGPRFLARAPGGSDAGEYRIDRPLTVFGRLAGAAPALSAAGTEIPLVDVYRAQSWPSVADYRRRQRARAHYFHYPYYYWPRDYWYGGDIFPRRFHRFGYWPRYHYYPFYRFPYYHFDPFYRW